MLVISLFQQSFDHISQDLIYADAAVLATSMSQPPLRSSLIYAHLFFSSLHSQYLLEAGWAAEGKVIGVTQPRRVAAISVRALLMSCYFSVNVKLLQENLFMMKDVPGSDAVISPSLL